MIACHCGATLYRGGDGEDHCIRCESRTDLCPACDGYGHRMRGRLMRTCEICGGSGSRSKSGARTSGSATDGRTESLCSAAFAPAGVFAYPAAAAPSTGRGRACGSTNGG